jgi:hypothetical protein
LRRGGSNLIKTRRPIWAEAFARVGLWLAAFALFAQSLAVVAPPMRMSDDPSAAVAELRAALGGSVVICSQAGKPGEPDHPHDCGQCPICQAVAGAAALFAPTLAGPIAPLRAVAASLPILRQAPGASAPRALLPFARGPPSFA